MKKLSIAGIVLGLISTFIYISNFDFSLYAFYIVTIAFSIFVIIKDDKFIEKERFLRYKSKTISLISAVIAIGIAFAHVYNIQLYFSQILGPISFSAHILPYITSQSDVIMTPFSLLSAYSFIKVYSFVDLKKVEKIVSIPVFWIILELIFIFRDAIKDPIYQNYILQIFVLASASVLVLQFAKVFCDPKKKNYFKSSYIITLFLVVAYLGVIIINNDFISFSFESVRVLLISAAALLYVTPFFFEYTRYRH